MPKKEIFIDNFLGGLAWGFGSVVGATIIIAILIKALSVIDFVPVVGEFAAGVVKTVNQKTQTK